MTGPPSGRTLRARLALLYASLFLGSGVAVLVVADLPLVDVGHASRATGHGPGSGAGGHSVTNLPEVLLYSGIALAVLAVLSIVVGWLVSDRALQPLRAITAAARAISASNLDERLSLCDSYDEFRELGDTLDDLFARLQAAFDSQRHFVANASHELRTPLTAERTVIQVALADPHATADSLRAACEQLLALGKQQERLIDALLMLASSQRGVQRRETFDLAELTGQIMHGRSAVAAERGVLVSMNLAPAFITGDRSLVESLVINLVDNAIRHNVTGGRMQIATTVGTGESCFAISNTGAKIPSAEIDRLFEPFQQLDGERTRHDAGHGLGLAIVRSIASAHAGVLAARSGPQGGLEITVRFPRAAGAAHG